MAVLSLYGFLSAGCVSTEQLLHKDKPPSGTVCQIVSTWNKEIALAADPTKGGAPTPGFTGRVYLFGKEISTPMIDDGCLVVDVFDDAPLANGEPAKMLEEWRIDKDTLARLVRKDRIGYGYTLFLPWGTIGSGVSQVHFRVRFEPSKGVAPLYTDSGTMHVERPGQPGATVVSRRETPKGTALPNQGTTLPSQITPASAKGNVP